MIFTFHGLAFLPSKQFDQAQNYGKTMIDSTLMEFFSFSWDYNYTVGEIAGRRMDCHCGSADCRRRVL